MFDKVLQIGINYFGTRFELNGCINDVNNIKSFLKKDLKCNTTQWKILTDNQKSGPSRPTRQNVINAIKWLTSDVKPNQKLFIHYSGHGSWTHDISNDEVDKRDETICALDGDIIDDDLRKILIDPLPAGAELYGIFDCCHSGTVCDLRYSYQIDYNKQQVTYHILPCGKVKDSNAKITIWSGCTDLQTSADAFLPRERQRKNTKSRSTKAPISSRAKPPKQRGGQYCGAMSWSFVKSFRELKRKNRSFRHKHFMKALIQNLKRKGFRQLPQISTGKMMNLDDIMW